jgi:hypothetical protein
MRFFIAGIMQGSHRGAALHEQDYRPRLKRLLLEYFPGSEIYDPLTDHQDSLDYDDERGRAVFYRHNRLCREVDVLVAFVPEASMGTAIEMWETHEHGRGIVITISPLSHNWAVRFCSHLVFADFAELESALAQGTLPPLIERLRAERRAAHRPSGAGH